MNVSNSRLLKQRLYRIHSSVGITFSIFIFISLFFGIFTIFKPYIENWENPSRYFDRSGVKNIDYEKILDSVITNPDYPKNNIYIEFPGFLNNPTVRITHKFMPANYFNPKTLEKIDLENEETFLAGFINQLHYGEPLMLIGKIIFGLSAVAGMVLIISGLILIIYLKFRNTGKNQQASFSKWHRKILMYTFPIFFIILLTGALMNIGYLSSKPMTSIVTKGKSNDIISYTNRVLKPIEKSIEAENKKADMLSIRKLIEKAEEINPNVNFGEIRLINWNDKNARVELIGYNPYKPFFNGIYNREKVLLDALNGRLIKDTRSFDASWVVLFADSFYFIHLLTNVDIYIRIFVAIIMGILCFGIGFAVMLWLEKEAKLFDNRITFYHWVGKVLLAIMLGIVPATATLFISQWLLPFDLNHRVLIQQEIFYISWIGTLTWSFYRINSYKAAKEFLFLGGVLFILTSLIHFFVTQYSPIELYKLAMYDILIIDIVFILFGSILIYFSKKIPQTRQNAKFFWNKKYKGINNA